MTMTWTLSADNDDNGIDYGNIGADDDFDGPLA